MGLFKIFFNLIILISTSTIGFIYGGSFKKRADNIGDLQYCLRVLESEILVGNIPLPQALENTYIKGKGQIAYIFYIIKSDLETENREDIYHSFQHLEGMLKDKYLLEQEDVEVLMFLGRTLGKTHRVDQEKNFNFIKKQIDELVIQANMERVRNEKLYRSLGVLVGVGMIIILV